MEVGKKNRRVGATAMNPNSSRSHSVFSITVESSEMLGDGSNHITVGKLNLVDLAGSERQAKTHAEVRCGASVLRACVSTQSLICFFARFLYPHFTHTHTHRASV